MTQNSPWRDFVNYVNAKPREAITTTISAVEAFVGGSLFMFYGFRSPLIGTAASVIGLDGYLRLFNENNRGLAERLSSGPAKETLKKVVGIPELYIGLTGAKFGLGLAEQTSPWNIGYLTVPMLSGILMFDAVFRIGTGGGPLNFIYRFLQYKTTGRPNSLFPMHTKQETENRNDA